MNMRGSLYRKYRPKTVSELRGQETNSLIISNAAKQNRLGHAYLFYGPRGTGKTTTARLLAKLLNCQTRATDPSFAAQGEPCNRCVQCSQIDSDTNLDVVEIDAASNRGIDEIRDLKEHIAIAPIAGRHKVYIIDEAHMLTTPAFNALLKTLEEPPAHGVIILATTELEKVPATIVSRSQRFLFKRPTKNDLVAKLSHIAKEEGIQAEGAAIELIALCAQGSFRDAESLLEQLSSSDTPITAAHVQNLTGRLGTPEVAAFARAVLSHDAATAQKKLRLLQEAGHDVTSFIRDLVHYFRHMLALTLDPTILPVLADDFTEEEIAALQRDISATTDQHIVAVLTIFLRAYGQMRYSPFPLVPLEVALYEIARDNDGKTR